MKYIIYFFLAWGVLALIQDKFAYDKMMEEEDACEKFRQFENAPLIGVC